MNPETILPCPFCGGVVNINPRPNTDGEAISCQTCDYLTILPIGLWNRRAPALAPFEKLVEEWRNHSALDAIGRLEQSDKAITLDSCADRLSAVVEEVRGK